MIYRSYKNRVLVISIPLLVMLSTIVLLIYLLAVRSVGNVVNDGLDRTAQLFESHLKFEQNELLRFATIVSEDINIKEYMFLVDHFDSGYDTLSEVYSSAFGGLPVDNAALVTQAGKIAYGKLDDIELNRLVNIINTKTKETLYIFRDNATIERTIVHPIFYKKEFIGSVILSSYYDQSWLDKMQQRIKGLLFIEKNRKIVRSTNALLLGETLNKYSNNIEVGDSVYQLYPVVSLGENDHVALWYGVSVTAATDNIGHFVSLSLLLTCFGIVIIIAVSYFITRNYEKPLAQLNGFISEIINGKLPEIDKQVERNEIDFLRNKFVDMVNTLKVKEQEVETAQRQLTHHAATDALTGMLNRRSFQHILNDMLGEIKKSGSTHAVCYIDLDQFKVVNDTCGHEAGNELLKQLTSLMKARVRKSDVLARLGGDEFGLIIRDADIKTALAVTENLLSLIRQFKYVNENRIFTVGASIGVVEISNETKITDELLNKADIACYAAKNKGRNRIVVYEDTTETEKTTAQGINWPVVVKEALDKNGFELWSQAIVATQHGERNTTWREIFLRMKTPDSKIVLPGAFMPTAERCDLMPQIDRWVITQTFDYIRKYHLYDHCFSINLSTMTVHDDHTVDFVKEQLARCGLKPHKVCFDVAESSLLQEFALTEKFIHELKKTGVSIAVDNFGAGLNSFHYLEEVPVDYIKIHGSLVSNMSRDEIDAVIVEFLQRIATILGKTTIALHVEDERLIEKLEFLNVGYVQGFGIDKPKPLDLNTNYQYKTG